MFPKKKRALFSLKKKASSPKNDVLPKNDQRPEIQASQNPCRPSPPSLLLPPPPPRTRLPLSRCEPARPNHSEWGRSSDLVAVPSYVERCQMMIAVLLVTTCPCVCAGGWVARKPERSAGEWPWARSTPAPPQRPARQRWGIVMNVFQMCCFLTPRPFPVVADVAVGGLPARHRAGTVHPLCVHHGLFPPLPHLPATTHQ